MVTSPKPAELKLPDAAQCWEAVWTYFTRLDKGKRLAKWEWTDLWLCLRECEAAQKDRSIALYIYMALRKRAKGQGKSLKLEGVSNGTSRSSS